MVTNENEEILNGSFFSQWFNPSERIFRNYANSRERRVFRIKYPPTFPRIMIPVSVQRIQVESLKFQDSCSYF